MRNFAAGLIVLAIGVWFVMDHHLPRTSKGRGLTGAFSGYSSAPSPAIDATKGMAKGILRQNK